VLERMQALRDRIADRIQQLGLARAEQSVTNPFATMRTRKHQPLAGCRGTISPGRMP